MLSCLLFFGGYCTITDLKSSIVPNKLILIGFLIGILLHIVYIFCGVSPYYPYWLINMVIADCIAFSMYIGKIWAAGDAKLFMLLYFLFPARLLDSGTLSHSIVPYIFIFVPALLWIICDSFMRILLREEKKRKDFSIKSFILSYAIIVVEATAFHCICTLLFPEMIEQQALFFSTLMLMYAYMCGVFSLMKRWYVFTIHALVIVVMWLYKQWVFIFPSSQTYLIIVLVVAVQRFCSLYNYQLVQTDKVKAGMIPAAETIIAFQASKIHSLPSNPSEELTAKMSEEEAEAVRRWGKSAKGKPNIWIIRKVPFAIMIYIGFIGWLLLLVLGR